MELLDELVAEREIQRLIALYSQYADDGDGESYAQLFAEDGAIVAGGERVEGRDAVKAWLLRTLRKPLRHLGVNVAITVESETAASGSMDLLLRTHDSGWQVWTTLRYEDQYVRTPRVWRFAERTLEAH